MIPSLLRFCAVLAVACVGTLPAAEVRRDIEYGRAGDVRLLLDARVPEGAGPFPVAILVHGGGWRRGDKAGSDEPGNAADITPWFAPLAQAGFVSFSINYRLAPAHRWPACFEDLQTAVRWVKAHAAEFRGDPRRIAVFGHSAGGHLVTMLATRSGDDTRVQAVVGFAAVTDHEQTLAKRGGLGTGLQGLLNLPQEVTPQSLNALRAISPINRVRAGMPPVLLLHGEADESVPIAQSVAFQKRVRAAGNTCDLIVLKGAPHGLIPWEKVQPDYRPQLIAWLKNTLGE